MGIGYECFWLVCMNDVSPYVACNGVRGFDMCGKMKMTVGKFYCLYSSLSWRTGEKKLKYCICYEIRVVCSQNTDRTRQRYTGSARWAIPCLKCLTFVIVLSGVSALNYDLSCCVL